ncbi:MAG TPA: valine--pyruvate transaminase [Gammaproteobacteria bacterium]|nr:valine--pyruvate transaminase [Gammaproteobacteria bacterium]
MKFSKIGQFVSGESGIVRLMNDLGEIQSAQRPFNLLGGGNPARIPEVESRFRLAIEQLVRQDGNFEHFIGHYDGPQGNLLFRQSIAELLKKECGWPVAADNIAVTNGSQESFFILFNLFAGEHDDNQFRRILLPLTPEYIGYFDAGLGQDLFRTYRPKIEHLGPHRFKYRVDFDNLTVAADVGALCVSRPTNPTGNVLTDAELEQLRQLAAEHNVPLLIDGAYGLPFPNIVFSQATPMWDDNTIVCLSLSKIGLPGVRTGIVVANTQVTQAIRGANAILNLAPSSFGPLLAQQLLNSGQLIDLAENHIQPYYHSRLEQAMHWLDVALDGTPYRIHVAEGAFFLWLWLEGLPVSSDVLYQRLKVRDTLVISGSHFFLNSGASWPHRHECLRISYAQAPDQVEQGIRIIGEEVRSAYAEGGA